MSAKQDRSQPIKFYYGNAAKDLNHLFPADENTHVFTSTPEHISFGPDFKTEKLAEQKLDLARLHQILDLASSHLGKISDNRVELSFLISDLKRMMG